jgi:hypothetical protein
MSKDELPDDLVLNETQFRQVIELATRTTPRSDGVSVAELRQIAQELDIDPESLARALDFVLTRPERKRPIGSWLSRRTMRLGLALSGVLPRRGRLIAGGLVGGFLGWVSAHVATGLQEVVNGIMVMRGSGAFMDIPIAILLILLTIANSFAHRVDGRRGRFIAETVACWGTFAVAWCITHGAVTADLIRFVVACLSLFCLGGWFVVRPWEGRGGRRTAEAKGRLTPNPAATDNADDGPAYLGWVRLAHLARILGTT